MSRVNLGAGAPKKSRKKSRKKITGMGMMPERYERKKGPLEKIFGIDVPQPYRGGGMVKKGMVKKTGVKKKKK